MIKNCSKIPEELHASSIRILYQNLKYLTITPSKHEKTESKKKVDELNMLSLFIHELINYQLIINH